jgi:hypothetical protein
MKYKIAAITILLFAVCLSSTAYAAEAWSDWDSRWQLSIEQTAIVDVDYSEFVQTITAFLYVLIVIVVIAALSVFISVSIRR